MALNVQFIKYLNQLINEEIVVPRLVNQQSLDFNALCDYLADGSTVTAADVAAVMKQIETRLPLLLGLNAKVVCSPEGLTFRPKVSGSITQSQLKKKLQAKLAADPSLDIDVDRTLTVSDLAVSDLTAEIAIELPKAWNERFKSKASFKRVTKATSTEGSDDTDPSTDSGDTGTDTGSNTNGTNGGTNTGGNTGTVTPSNPRLTISRSGNGTSSVTVGGNAVTSGSEVEVGTEVSLSVTPAEDATPTATLNGNTVALTENDGVYTGSFTMPSANATLAINSGGATGGGSGDMN